MTTQQRSAPNGICLSVRLAFWVLQLCAVAVEADLWSQLSPSGVAPTARAAHTAVWSDAADGMYVFDGYNASSSFPNDLQFYDRQANRWEELYPSGAAPPARNLHTAVWSDAADGMYVFGGYRSSYGYFNDLQFYDRKANRWSQLSPSGVAPTARYAHTAVWSDVADGMYVFGGYHSGPLNDLQFFDRQANRWSQLSPGGARYRHTAVWSDVADGMYVFGGYHSDARSHNDLQFYDRQANRWSQLSPSGAAPTARSAHTAVWSDVADGMYVFGGRDAGDGYLNDLQFFDRQANSWTELAPKGTLPTGRSSHSAVWSKVADGMYIFGGGDSSDNLNDVFFYQDDRFTTTQTQTTSTLTKTTTQTKTTSTSTSHTQTLTSITSTSITSTRTTQANLYEPNLDEALSVPAIVVIALTTCCFFVVIALLLLRFCKMRQSQQDSRKQQETKSTSFARVDIQSADSQHGSARVDIQSADSQHGSARVDIQSADSQHGSARVDIQSADSQHGSARVDIQSADSQHGSAELGQKQREAAEAKASSVSAADSKSAPENSTDEGTWVAMFSALFDGGFCGNCSSQQAQQAADVSPSRPEPKTSAEEEEETFAPVAVSGHGRAVPTVSSKPYVKYGRSQLEVKISRGDGTPLVMFSARFDGGPVERKIRRVHEILCEHKYEALMVEVDAGESFGTVTARYLSRLKVRGGIMIAVCTANYGEMTTSKYSSYYELKFAHTHGIKVLPLKMEDTYPPKPPCGEDHLDKECDAHGYIHMVFTDDVVFVDCRQMSDMDIARKIAAHLCKLRDGKKSFG